MTTPRRSRKPRVVELGETEASMVLSDSDWISGCPICSVFGRVEGKRRGCEALAYETGFWSRTPSKIAKYIRVRPRGRGR